MGAGTLEKHVFLSYLRDDSVSVNRLSMELRQCGVKIWLDKEDIYPGIRWKVAIRNAIRDGGCFIACFSEAYAERTQSYMNEELTLAIEELRKRPSNMAWFIPIKLSPCDIPDLSISSVETLQDLQYVELYTNWKEGVSRIVSAIQGKSRFIPPPILNEFIISILAAYLDQGLNMDEAVGLFNSLGFIDDDLTSIQRDATNVHDLSVDVLRQLSNSSDPRCLQITQTLLTGIVNSELTIRNHWGYCDISAARHDVLLSVIRKWFSTEAKFTD